jgi:hypothetical protein
MNEHYLHASHVLSRLLFQNSNLVHPHTALLPSVSCTNAATTSYRTLLGQNATQLPCRHHTSMWTSCAVLHSPYPTIDEKPPYTSAIPQTHHTHGAVLHKLHLLLSDPHHVREAHPSTPHPLLCRRHDSCACAASDWSACHGLGPMTANMSLLSKCAQKCNHATQMPLPWQHTTRCHGMHRRPALFNGHCSQP